MEALGVNPPSHAVHLNVVDVLVVLQDHTVAGRDRSVDAVANSHSVVLYVDARLSTGHRKLQMQLARIAKPIMCEVGGGCNIKTVAKACSAPHHDPDQRHLGRCPKVSSPLVEGLPRTIALSAVLASATTALLVSLCSWMGPRSS